MYFKVYLLEGQYNHTIELISAYIKHIISYVYKFINKVHGDKSYYWNDFI